MKKITILLSLILLSAAFSQTKKQDGNLKSNNQKAQSLYNKQIKMEIEILSSFAKSKGYKLPSDTEFNERCADYFGINTTVEKTDDHYLQLKVENFSLSTSKKYLNTFTESIFYDSNVKGEVSNENATKELERKDNEESKKFIAYNKVLFNDDIPAVSYFLNNPDDAITIVVKFDYEKNNMLFKSTLTKIKDLEDFSNTTKSAILWYNNRNKSEIIRKKLVTDLQKENPELIFNLTDWLGTNPKIKQSENKSLIDKTVAFLINLQLEKSNTKGFNKKNQGYVLLTNNFIDDKQLLNRFKKENFYEYPFLKEASKNYEENSGDAEPYYGIVNDKDGYTNLRNEKNTSSKIIEEIKTGEKIEIVKDVDEKWFYVKTKAGHEGFISKSRIIFK